jgi:hypothetical protein
VRACVPPRLHHYRLEGAHDLSPYHHLFLGLYSVQHYPANDAGSFKKGTETWTETETETETEGGTETWTETETETEGVTSGKIRSRLKVLPSELHLQQLARSLPRPSSLACPNSSRLLQRICIVSKYAMGCILQKKITEDRIKACMVSG